MVGQVPSGWVKTKVGEIYEFAYGKGLVKKVRKETGPYPVYGSNGIVGYHDEYIVPGPKVIVGRKGAAGAVHYCNDNCWPIDTTYFINSINVVDLKFSYYLLKSLRLKQFETSTAIPGLNRDDAYRLDILIPPFNEQKRIVAKIEELFSELDNGIAALKTAREQLKVYRQAVLKHAFEGKLTAQWRAENQDKLESPEQLLARIQQEREARYQQQLEQWKTAVKEWEANCKEGKKPSKPKKYKPAPLVNDLTKQLPAIPNGWKWISFSELLFSIRGGTTVPPIDISTEFPILRSSSIRAGKLNLEDVRYLPEGSKVSSEDYLEYSDLLFSRLNGTLEFVGVCASVPSGFPQNLLYPDRLYCAKLVDSDMASFCEYYFSNPVVRGNIEKKAKSTAGHKRISIPDISEQPIPILDKGELRELVKSISEKFSFVEKLQQEIETSLLEAETLRQSILKKAFSGQLVPQDPNDEPASELLARIQAEKAANARKKAAAKSKVSAKPAARRGNLSRVTP
jgi:type I restriction enzyme S subunit